MTTGEDPGRIEPHQHTGSLWAFSDRRPDGGYALAIQWGEDKVYYPPGPAAYARHLIAVAVGVAHDAAVINQLVKTLSIPAEDAVKIAAELRAARPPLNDAATGPLRFRPLVAARNGQPYIIAEDRATGTAVSQMTFAAAIAHATYVLTAAQAAALDNGYRDYLAAGLDLDPDRIAAAVGGLNEHITDYDVLGYQAEDADHTAAVFGRWIATKDDAPAPTEPFYDVGTAPPGSSRAILAAALADAHAPAWLVRNANNGLYDDYLSTVAMPQHQLLADLQRSGLPENVIAALADRVKDGDFDGTAAESAAWARSKEGRETLSQFPGFPAEDEDEEGPGAKP